MKAPLIIFLSSLISFQIHAGVADLALSMQINGIENGVQGGQQGTYTVTITNNGPDIAAEGIAGVPITAISSPIPLVEGGPAIDFLPDDNDDPRCGFAVAISEPSPFDPARFGFFVEVPSLDVGESIECAGFYTVNITSGELTISWSLSSQFDTDPDKSNNSASFLFGLVPAQVPTTSIMGLIILIVFLVVLSTKTHRSFNRRN